MVDLVLQLGDGGLLLLKGGNEHRGDAPEVYSFERHCRIHFVP